MANFGKTPAVERSKYHSLRGIHERPRRAQAKPESILPTSPSTSKVPRAKNAAKEVASASKAKATLTSRPVASVTRSTVQVIRNTSVCHVSDQLGEVVNNTLESSSSFQNETLLPIIGY